MLQIWNKPCKMKENTNKIISIWRCKNTIIFNIHCLFGLNKFSICSFPVTLHYMTLLFVLIVVMIPKWMGTWVANVLKMYSLCSTAMIDSWTSLVLATGKKTNLRYELFCNTFFLEISIYFGILKYKISRYQSF